MEHGPEEECAQESGTLCRDALFFVILSEGSSACGMERSRYPGFFQDIPENYQGFVPKQKVEEVARTIFAQEVSQHVAPRARSLTVTAIFSIFPF